MTSKIQHTGLVALTVGLLGMASNVLAADGVRVNVDRDGRHNGDITLTLSNGEVLQGDYRVLTGETATSGLAAGSEEAIRAGNKPAFRAELQGTRGMTATCEGFAEVTGGMKCKLPHRGTLKSRGNHCQTELIGACRLSDGSLVQL